MISITFTQLLIGVAIGSAILTGALKVGTDRIKNLLVSFLQNFCGLLFVVSGWVKAIDPLGTAYKMEQYFGEFQGVFEPTAFNFLSGLFPIMSEYSIAFSVFMIVLEVVVGIMLIIGAKPKFSAWVFFLTIVFFTILTGFTYLTGYVGSEVNFFEFSKWGPYVKSNMKVTDCGCFGDFLKLEPKVSFMKDVFLLIPSIIFLFSTKEMHQLFNKKTRNIITAISTIGLLWYCMSNYVWDLPHTDFRPFREGVHMRDVRAAELDAMNNQKIIAYQLKNKKSGKVVELSYPVFLKEYTKYPKADWEFIQIKEEPKIKSTKLSEFFINDADGNDISDDLLAEPDYRFWIISHKVPYELEYEEIVEMDTLYRLDSIQSETSDEILISKAVAKVEETRRKKPHYTFDPQFIHDYEKELVGLVKSSGIPAITFLGGVDLVTIENFKQAIDLEMAVYEADDILLKTIVRSNPGLLLVKDGVLVQKWHKENLPSLKQIQEITGK